MKYVLWYEKDYEQSFQIDSQAVRLPLKFKFKYPHLWSIKINCGDALTAAPMCVQQWDNILEKVSDCNVLIRVHSYIIAIVVL